MLWSECIKSIASNGPMATPDSKTLVKETDLVTIDSKDSLDAYQTLMSQNGPKNA